MSAKTEREHFRTELETYTYDLGLLAEAAGALKLPGVQEDIELVLRTLKRTVIDLEIIIQYGATQ